MQISYSTTDGNSVTVSNSGELFDAIRDANAGDVIYLEGSEYKYSIDIDIWEVAKENWDRSDNPITLKSLDSNNMSTLEEVSLNRVSGINFEDLYINNLKIQRAKDIGINNVEFLDSKGLALDITRSSDISISNSNFIGNATGFAEHREDFSGSGLRLSAVDGLNINNNIISHYGHGIGLGDISNASISENIFEYMQGDNLRSYLLNNVIIENNIFRDPYGSDQKEVTHVDYLQIWSTGQDEPSENVTIRGNDFLSGKGDVIPQAIFIRNEAVDRDNADSSMLYRNFVIEDNVIYNGHYHNISVGFVEGLVVRNNTIIPDQNEAFNRLKETVNIYNSNDVSIENNVSVRFSVRESDLISIKDNVVIQDIDPMAPNYVGNIFENPFEDLNLQLSDLKIKPNSFLVKQDGSVYGSQRLNVSGTLEETDQAVENSESHNDTEDAEVIATPLSPFLFINGVETSEVVSYGANRLGVNQDFGDAIISVDGGTVSLTNNAWKSVELEQTITANTVLSFEFKADVAGEIHGIGFDTDDALSVDRTFQLAGSQIWGIQSENGSYDVGDGWQQFNIRVGDYFTGDFDRLVFAMDDDAGVSADSAFRNVEIADELPFLFINGVETSEVVSYGANRLGVNQDFGDAIISVDGGTVSLTNNAWKSVELEQTITANTVLSFEFKADVAGEIHGIGFDTDDALSVDRTFQLAGSQIWGIQSENGSYDVGDGWQQFNIRVGDYFTGDFDRLVFAMDDDAGVSADSAFRNVEIADELPFLFINGVETSEVVSYGANRLGVNQDFGDAIISVDGGTVSLTNNAWKSVELEQTITANTVLSFEFKADVAGEIHGIGFDTDDALSVDRTFQLAGSQIWGIQSENGSYDVGDGWQQFNIRVGDYFTGDFDRLVFAMDDDAGVSADSAFRNVEIADELPFLFINGVETSEVVSYGANRLGVNQDFGDAIISVDGGTVSLTNNAWKSVELEQTITANTVLSFEFKADVAGEIHGIGFDTDDALSVDRTFQLAGSQIWGIQSENGSYDVGDGWQQFNIRVGDYFTGDFDRLVFAMDDDAGVSADSAFRNVEIADELPFLFINGVETSEVVSYGANRLGVNQDFGDAIISVDGGTVSLTNNAWKSVELEQTITANTVLSFEFKADVAGEIHGIGFDTDDALSVDRTFQLAGSQIWGIQSENGSYDVGDGWQQFNIRVGDYFTGDFDRLVFAMDDDAGVSADSAFRNVEIADELPFLFINGVETSEVVSYGANRLGVNQDFGDAIISVDGGTVSLTNNAWKSVELEQTITANTVLSFEFKADVAGEIHGIGFDTDDALSVDRTFQLAGSQIWGIQSENGSYDVGDGWQQFNIRVGDYFTGDFDRLVFAMDDDAGVSADSAFRNVEIADELNLSLF